MASDLKFELYDAPGGGALLGTVTQTLPVIDGLFTASIAGNCFLIAGGSAGAEVSWQVTGVRQDAYAEANPMQVEVPKRGSEPGQYIHRAASGLPETRNVQ